MTMTVIPYNGYKIEKSVFLHDEAVGFDYAITKDGVFVGGAWSICEAKWKIDNNFPAEE